MNDFPRRAPTRSACAGLVTERFLLLDEPTANLDLAHQRHSGVSEEVVLVVAPRRS